MTVAGTNDRKSLATLAVALLIASVLRCLSASRRTNDCHNHNRHNDNHDHHHHWRHTNHRCY